jgi:hypothetical protein
MMRIDRFGNSRWTRQDTEGNMPSYPPFRSTRYPTRHRWPDPISKELSCISMYLPVPVSPYFSISTPLDTEEVVGSNPIVHINNLQDGSFPSRLPPKPNGAVGYRRLRWRLCFRVLKCSPADSPQNRETAKSCSTRVPHRHYWSQISFPIVYYLPKMAIHLRFKSSVYRSVLNRSIVRWAHLGVMISMLQSLPGVSVDYAASAVIHSG